MTIGKLPNVQALDDAYNEVKALEDTFCAMVDKISVEVIGEHEESIVVIEKRLL